MIVDAFQKLKTGMTDDTVPGNLVIEDIYFDEVYWN